MGNIPVNRLETEAYSLTVNLFSFYKTLKENNIHFDNSSNVLKSCSEISTFVLSMEEEPCKNREKIGGIVERAAWCMQQIENHEVSEKYAQQKANLVVQLHTIQKELRILQN